MRNFDMITFGFNIGVFGGALHGLLMYWVILGGHNLAYSFLAQWWRAICVSMILTGSMGVIIGAVFYWREFQKFKIIPAFIVGFAPPAIWNVIMVPHIFLKGYILSFLIGGIGGGLCVTLVWIVSQYISEEMAEVGGLKKVAEVT